MILFGASGHSLVIKEILEDSGQEVNLYYDDDPIKKEYHGIPVRNNYKEELLKTEDLIICIGSNKLRKKVALSLNVNFQNAIASNAFISKHAKIGSGTVVFYNVNIQSDAEIGDHCILNNGCSVDHECQISNFVHIAPGAILCGNVSVGELTMIGAGATVIQGITIGKNVIIGAGTVVISDVPDNAVVVGNPGRIIKNNYE